MTPADELGAVRIALGLGDQELEQRLRPALDADGDFHVAVQCLAADLLLEAVEAGEVDALIVGWGLHRLTEAILDRLERSRLPLVLLVPDADEEHWQRRQARVVPLDVEPEALCQAVHAAVRGEPVTVKRPRLAAEPPITLKPADTLVPLTMLAVSGGGGSPGRTTVAINLATALGAVAPTVLVDADFSNPSVAAYLNRDPSQNLCTLAHAVRESPASWPAALRQELQPLHPRSPAGVVLCGLPKRELRTSMPAAVLERLLAELARAFRYVVVDVGAEVLGMDALAVAHRAVLGAAQHVLLVTGSDLVSLWHARTLLAQLERHLAIERERVSLVINRHDPRHHHARDEIEWHLGVAAAAMIGFDYGPAQRAVSEQHPMVTDPTSRAGRALIELAERIHHGQVRLPPPAAHVRANGTTSGWQHGLADIAAKLTLSRPRGEM